LNCHFFEEINKASPMTEKHTTELTSRAFDLGFRRGYEIANRTPIAENTGREAFTSMVLETAINSLESTVFESISAELDMMHEKYSQFDSWKIFSEGVVYGAGENFSDRTGH
jgi:hypothetical protein